MQIITKLFSALFSGLLPKKYKSAINSRIYQTKEAFTSNVELKVFWRLVFFPIVLPLSMLIALLKTVFIWIFPSRIYGDFKYLINQFYTDVVYRNTDIPLAWKRVCLCHELFTKGAEKAICCGEKNPDNIFYVIRPYYFLEPNEFIFRNVANLLTQYYYCMQKLSYAIENGWIPVIDWQNYGLLPHAEEEPVNGTTNSWEYYWSQPSNYSLEEVYESKNVILSTQNIGQFGYIPNCQMTPPFNQYAENLVRLCPKYSQQIPFNELTDKHTNHAYSSLFPHNKRILGVVVRGASYGRTGTPYRSHPAQVGMKELIRKVKSYCLDWDMEYIFFVNEMQELVDAMKNEFGEKLIVLPRMRDNLDRSTDGETKNPLYHPGNRYQTNLDYVTEIALLSRCTSLVGSMSSGTRAALIWNAGDYEDVHIFERGLW